jgi:hypothetical protein
MVVWSAKFQRRRTGCTIVTEVLWKELQVTLSTTDAKGESSHVHRIFNHPSVPCALKGDGERAFEIHRTV